ncbi:ATP-binding protein [Actinoplanes aureus]|uniref:AAA family ATPase n=1 Tax=Actinoplanes aureus TaxID=2792083 RepID=A0A931CI74_9ACTN|nr:LuxR family transcriptional regulator [Actinoplanes aureus]MBG0569059.1 AAA family ATPase [Actinoplanes aureus]
MSTRLVARVAEVVTLDRLRVDAAAGSGAVALLTGEAGIGKTAVVEEAVARAYAAGATVLTGRADPDEGAPAFWPWLRLLDCDLPGLSPALLTTGDTGESPAAARFRAMQATVRALRAAAAGADGGLVLVLEDLHWADPGSLTLLATLSRDLADAPLLVVATARALDTDLPGAEILALRPWDQATVATYLAQQADGPVHASWPPVVHRLGGGNPLYTRELARLLAASGGLRRPAAALDLPDGLLRLVGRRIAGLGTACRDLLGLASALGTDVDVVLLTRIADGPVEPLLAEAIAAGVLVEDPWAPARLRFAHELVREARYAQLSRTERIAAHERIAAALAGSAARADETARHRVRAAVDERSRHLAREACTVAAREATRRLDHHAAATWLGQAVDLFPADPWLRLARAEAACRDGRLGLAVADCTTVLELAEAERRTDLAAAAALVVRGYGGQAAAAVLRLCERALALDADTRPAPAGPSTDTGPDRGDAAVARAELLAHYAILLVEAGQHGRAGPISREAMALAERIGDPQAMAAAVHARHEVLDLAADTEEILDLARRSCELAAAGGRVEAELWGRLWRLDASLTVGDLPGYDAATAALAGLAERLGWPVVRWHLLRARAARLLIGGRIEAAGETAAEAFAQAEIFDNQPVRELYAAFRACLAVFTGDVPEWPGGLTAALARFGSEPIAVAQIGRLAMLSGDRSVGAQCARGLRAMLPGLPPDSRRAFVVLSAGEIGVWLDDRDLAADAYAGAQPWAGRYLNTMTACHGAVARPLGTIAAALGDRDAADRHHLAAIEMEDRIGAAPFAAQARLAYAQTLRDLDARRSRALAEEALTTARRLGLAAIAGAAAALTRDDLTAREREIVKIAAEGLPNRVIAERLHISERTVETHVRNALAKLGLVNRTQLAARLSAGNQYQH